MNTCATCKYQGESYIHTEFHDKVPVRIETPFHECQRIFFDGGGDRLPPNTKAYIVDGSGYYAALRTRDDFGCVDWEMK